jgi:hypothetical protein
MEPVDVSDDGVLGLGTGLRRDGQEQLHELSLKARVAPWAVKGKRTVS